MNQFLVQYFDGISSKHYQAKITLYNSYWQLSLEENGAIIIWNCNQISIQTINTAVVVCNYGSFPKQSITSTNTHFIQAIQHQFNTIKNTQPIGLSTRLNGKKVVLLLSAVVGLAVAIYLVVIPFVTGFLAEKLPYTYQQKMGEQMFNSIIDPKTINKKATLKVNEFVQNINFGNEHPINVTVVNDKELNAFAMPGGHIVVYSKMIEATPNYPAFAALLAHEIAHEKNKHVVKSIGRNIAGYLFISLLLNDVNGVSSVLINNAQNLSSLKYSRSLEQEADDDGLAILKENAIPQIGFVDLFKVLQDSSKMEMEITLLSSHPLTKKRLAHAKAISSKQTNAFDNNTLQSLWADIKLAAKQ